MKNIVIAMQSASIGQASSGRDVISLIKNATPVGKFALLVLLIFSIVSWAVIIFKLVEYARAKTNSQKFIQFFRKTRNFSDINKFAGGFQNNPLAEIFRYGYKELSHQLGTEQSQLTLDSAINVESLNRSLVRASNSEITRLERLNGFLATTASVTPFIGLFGTVWGLWLLSRRLASR